MRTRFISSIRWKFIALIFLSGILTVVGMFVMVSMAYIMSRIEPFGSIIRYFASGELAFLMLILMSLGMFIALYFLLSQKSISYLEEISKALGEIARGQFDTKIPRKFNNELGDLAENINAMSYQLKKSIEEERNSERTKNELITSVSHDLRTPLTSIIGYLDLIVNNKYKDEVEMMYFADIAYNKANRLKKLIDELFEFTKISNEGIRINPVRVNLGELLEQLAEEFVPILADSDMKYRLKVPKERIYIMADGEMIVRVYENLISNAIRYGKEGRYVDIEMERAGNEAVVKVTNYGDPISEKELPFVFERFYRVEKSRSDKTGGTGLGLAIAKNIIKLHNGQISAYATNESTVFETRFTIL